MKHDDDSLISLFARLRDDPAAIPTDSFRTNARIRVLNRIRPTPAAARHIRMPKKVWQILTGAVAVPALLGAGIVLAAQSSGPANPLYPVKIASERAALAAAPGGALKTSIAVGILKRRADELTAATKTANTKREEDARSAATESLRSIRDTKQVSETAVNTLIREEPILRKAFGGSAPSGEDTPRTPTETPSSGQGEGTHSRPGTHTERQSGSEGSLPSTPEPSITPESAGASGESMLKSEVKGVETTLSPAGPASRESGSSDNQRSYSHDATPAPTISAFPAGEKE
ncbi:hypothetical protein M1555_01890 [Patescibacteria group bacterium]|nr:hypothetical protein [Patescibacteria group bacterium]